MTTNEQTKTHITLPSDTEVKVERTFNAPRALVWQMYTQAEHLVHWWGPKGWTLPVCEVDFRPGGTWFYCMQAPPDVMDGMMSCGKAYYGEIDEPTRYTYKDVFVDDEGNEQAGMPVAESVIEFVEHDGKTTVINITRYPTKADRDTVIEMGMEAGISQTMDRLDDYIAQQS